MRIQKYATQYYKQTSFELKKREAKKKLKLIPNSNAKYIDIIDKDVSASQDKFI